MKFVHTADCHVGGWRDPKMRALSIESFEKFVDEVIDINPDFVLISGDLFNTSHPPIDALKSVVTGLKKLNDQNISVYAIAGSHDFSPTGKTMLDVLENAGLLVNVVKGEVKDKKLTLKFTTDEKSGVKIAGMLGKKGMLDKKFYEVLNTKDLEEEKGFKIFMFHTSITELKPKSLEKMDSHPVSLLPKGFNYYAGGHVHIVEEKSIEGYKNIVYPGPLFPNNFREIEELKNGTYYVYDDKISKKDLHIKNTECFKFSADNKTPETVYLEIMDEIKRREFLDTLILIRVVGKLKSGKAADIDFGAIFKTLYDKSAYFVMKSTSLVASDEFEEIQVSNQDSVEAIEQKLILEHNLEFDKKTMLILMKAFSNERLEDEKVQDYDKRVKEEADKILGL